MEKLIDKICRDYCFFYKKNKDLPLDEKCGTFKLFYKIPFIIQELFPKKIILPEINRKIIEVFCKSHCEYYIKDCDWTNPEVKNKKEPCGGFFFLHEIFNKYALLNNNFYLKNLESFYLFDRENDELYELDENAVEFFQKCNGKFKVYEIINDFDSFLYLVENKIILLEDKKSFKYIKFNYKKPPLPSLRYLEIQLTTKCNLNCKHCYLGKKAVIHLDFELLKKILDDFQELQGLRVMFSGGEPFLYKDIEKLISILKEYSFRRVFLTNGTLIDENLLENIDEIQISIDGLEKSHDFIRGEGTFRKIVKNIEKIKEKNIDISVSTMIHKNNLHEFDKLENLIKSIGVIEWGIDVPVVTGNFLNHQYLKISPEEAKNPLSKKFGGSFHEPVKGYACGVHLATIFPDGKVSKCGFYYNNSFGDLNKQSLKECLKNKPFLKLKELECYQINCEQIEHCRGGCRFRAGDEFKKDEYMCELFLKNE